MEHLVVQIYYNINFILKYSFYGGKKKIQKVSRIKLKLKINYQFSLLRQIIYVLFLQ